MFQSNLTYEEIACGVRNEATEEEYEEYCNHMEDEADRLMDDRK